MSTFIFESAVFSKARFVSNVLLIVLLAGNLWFGVQYIEQIHQSGNTTVQGEDATFAYRLQVSRFLQEFIDNVLSTQGTVSFDERVKLENDIIQLNDPALTAQWNVFVNSKTTTDAQTNAVKLMSMLAARTV